MRAAPVFFLADAHLGAESKPLEAARENRLHEFLNSLHGRASELVVAGDLFDFWFEYRSAIPRRHFATLSALRSLREAGVGIHYLTGNHDFWLGSFLAEELGARTVSGALTLETQGRRIWIHHGDGLVGGDLGYRVVRRILRSPVSIRLYQLLHPDLGIPLAHLVSRWSRRSRWERPLDSDRLWREVAAPRFAEGFDAVIIGHFHHAHHRHEGSRDLLVLGDWIERATYAVLEDGVLTLREWGA